MPSSLADDLAHRAVHWQLEQDADGIAWLALDKAGASTNSLSREVMQELDRMLAHIASAPPRALIVTSAKRGFIAGADIKEFVGIQNPEQAYELIRQGQRVLDRLAALPCPTVAAINGFALGGGLEVALACRYRVVADDPAVTLGFPEVRLGVHPGFGGTVRAVQLAGPIAAMDLMLTGRSIRPGRALEIGLVDRLAAPEALRAAARQLALEAPAARKAPFKDRLLNSTLLRPLLASQMRAKVAKHARQDHYPAPYDLIELWQRFGASGPRAYEAEARSMARLLCTPTSRNLVRVFFLQDRLKQAGKGAGAPVRRVHVVGAGVMGADIAAWCAAQGLMVTLQDRSSQYIESALRRTGKFFEKRYADPGRRSEAMARLSADVEGAGLAQADIVIEAIYEDLQAKRELYTQLEPRMRPEAVLATNTSSIVLEQLAERLARPERFIGLHFFNPVARMPLVEVIDAQASDPAKVQIGLAFARQIDKLAIACRSSPGFLVNRVLMPYLSEAVRAAQEGIALASIDQAAENFGMPMGPIELADVVGLDVVMSVGRVFFEQGAPVPAVLATRYEQKQFGKKSGVGFYVWRDDKPQKPAPTSSPPADLEDRLLLPLINEAVAVLRENLVEDADLIDAGIIFGAGFAPFRGGPIHYARSRGVEALLDRMEQLRRTHGERFAPDPGWAALR